MTRLRRDAGISMILVVVLIFITIILGVVATVLWSNFKAAERRVAQLKAAEVRLQNEEVVIKKAMTDCNLATGIPAREDGKLDASKAEEVWKRWRQEYWSPEHLNKYPFTENIKDPRKPLEAGQIEAFNTARDNSSYLGTLEGLVTLAAERTSHVKNRHDALVVEQQSAAAAAAAIAAVEPQMPKSREEMKARLIADIQRLGQEIAKENEQYTARKTLLSEARAKAEEEIQAEVEKFASDEIRVNNEIRELRRQLEELKVKEVISHELSFIHGKILRPDVPNKTAFIDIGARERVVPGLKFLVGKKGMHGKFDYKAKVEVKKAWMTYAEVAIVEVFNPKERPVVDGDYIVNPLFSKDRPIVVAFVGEERPTRLRYSVDEATRRIREIGSEVRKDVALDVDYVVFTEGTSSKPRENYDAFKKAVFLEIPIAEASDVYRFLGD